MKAKTFEQIGVESQIFEESFAIENALLPSKMMQLYPAHLKNEVPGLMAAPLKKDHLTWFEKISSRLTSLIAAAIASAIELCLDPSKKEEFLSSMWF